MATSRSSALAVLVVASLACVGAATRPEAGESLPAVAASQDVIQHVSPARDSIGPQPKAFEWTAVPGADGYALLLVNEVDMEMWEVTVRETSVEVPQALVLESGTYYWAVGAFRAGRQVAYSGRSAFVILR